MLLIIYNLAYPVAMSNSLDDDHFLDYTILVPSS